MMEESKTSANRLRFRAWHRNEKTMTYGGYFQTLEIDGVNQEWFGMPTPHPDDCEIGQSTGLLDKNGKEIFEGDYINVTAPLYDDYIEWQKKNGGYVVKWRDDECCFGLWDGERWECPIDWWVTKEIIGNIYENPDLLPPTSS